MLSSSHLNSRRHPAIACDAVSLGAPRLAYQNGIQSWLFQHSADVCHHDYVVRDSCCYSARTACWTTRVIMLSEVHNRRMIAVAIYVSQFLCVVCIPLSSLRLKGVPVHGVTYRPVTCLMSTQYRGHWSLTTRSATATNGRGVFGGVIAHDLHATVPGVRHNPYCSCCQRTPKCSGRRSRTRMRRTLGGSPPCLTSALPMLRRGPLPGTLRRPSPPQRPSGGGHTPRQET